MAPDKPVNGINGAQLFETVAPIQEKPELAGFTFRSRNTWIGGTHNRGTVKDFYSALTEDHTREAMVFERDEPPVLCGQN